MTAEFDAPLALDVSRRCEPSDRASRGPMSEEIQTCALALECFARKDNDECAKKTAAEAAVQVETTLIARGAQEGRSSTRWILPTIRR
ncbi:MAG: hypothetical protein WA418_12745 [Bradyrhizobium sp.]